MVRFIKKFLYKRKLKGVLEHTKLRLELAKKKQQTKLILLCLKKIRWIEKELKLL